MSHKRHADTPTEPNKKQCTSPMATRVLMQQDVLSILLAFTGARDAARMHVCRGWRAAITQLPWVLNWHITLRDHQLVMMSLSTWALKHITSVRMEPIATEEMLLSVLMLLRLFERLADLSIDIRTHTQCHVVMSTWARSMHHLRSLALNTSVSFLNELSQHFPAMPALHTLDIRGSVGNITTLSFQWIERTHLHTLLVREPNYDKALAARQLHVIGRCPTLRRLEAGAMLPEHGNDRNDSTEYIDLTLGALVRTPLALQTLHLGLERCMTPYALASVAQMHSLTNLQCAWPPHDQFENIHLLSRLHKLQSIDIVLDAFEEGPANMLPVVLSALPPSVTFVTVQAPDADVVVSAEHVQPLAHTNVTDLHFRHLVFEHPALDALTNAPVRCLQLQYCTGSAGDLMALLLTLPTLRASCMVEDDCALKPAQLTRINHARSKPITVEQYHQRYVYSC